MSSYFPAQNSEQGSEDTASEQVDGSFELVDVPKDYEFPSWFDVFKEYCLWMMYSFPKCQFSMAVAAGAAVSIYVWYHNRPLQTKLPVTSRVNDAPKTLSSHNQGYHDLLKRLQEQNEKEEEELERAHQLKIRNSNSNLNDNIRYIKEKEKQFYLENNRQRLESKTQLENLKLEFQLRSLIRDQMIQFGERTHEDGHKNVMDNLEKESEANRKDFEDKLVQSSTDFRKSRVKFQEEELARKQNDLIAEQEFQQRIMRLREQLEQDLAEMRLRDETRRKEMEQQLHAIEKYLQMKVWNVVIENNWTRRLNTLRSANDDVRKVGWNFHASRDPGVRKVHLEHLKKAVEIEKSLMANESAELERMHRETGKEFLIAVKESVDDVRRECERLQYAIENEASLVDSCVSRLSHASREIPTVEELKRQFMPGS